MEAHKPTAETISSSRGSNCPPKCQWIGSSSEEMELRAQMGAHTAPPPADNGSEMVRVFACAGLSALSHSSQSVFRYGRSSMHVPNLCACVCIRVGERSLTPTVDTGSVTV